MAEMTDNKKVELDHCVLKTLESQRGRKAEYSFILRRRGAATESGRSCVSATKIYQ